MDEKFKNFSKKMLENYSNFTAENSAEELANIIRMAAAKVTIEILSEYRKQFPESQS